MRKDISTEKDAPSLVVRSSTEAVGRVLCPVSTWGEWGVCNGGYQEQIKCDEFWIGVL